MESVRQHRGSLVRHRHGHSGSKHVGRVPCVRTQAQSRTKVVELLVLLEARQGTSPEDQTAMVEQLWSMQYAAPGIVTACGGPLSYLNPPLSPAELQGLQGPALAQSSGKQASRSTHGVQFRFSNQTHAQAFLHNSSVKGMLTVVPAVPPPSIPADDLPLDTPGPICINTSITAFQGSVESDMDALFRRGQDFESGYELIMTLRSTLPCVAAAKGAGVPAGLWRSGGAETDKGVTGSSGQNAATAQVQVAVTDSAAAAAAVMRDEDVAVHAAAVHEFLSELALLAQSSVAGAVQVSFGPVIDVQTTDAQPTPSVSEALGGVASQNANLACGEQLVFMARFPSRQQLQAFRQAPPCVALWQQRAQLEREATGKVLPLLPVCAEAEAVMSVTPGEG